MIMDGKEHIGKVVSVSTNPIVGHIKCRISEFETRTYKFGASTKETVYNPIQGDRVSFKTRLNKEGVEYVCSIRFLMTGVT